MPFYNILPQKHSVVNLFFNVSCGVLEDVTQDWKNTLKCRNYHRKITVLCCCLQITKKKISERSRYENIKSSKLHFNEAWERIITSLKKQTIIINTYHKDVVQSVPRSCLCCSPSSSALIPALLSSSNTTTFSACLTIPGGAITAARPSTLSCWSLGWSKDKPWPPGSSAAPTPGPAPAPTTTSGASSCFWVMAGFFKAVHKWSGKVRQLWGIYLLSPQRVFAAMTPEKSAISWPCHSAMHTWPAVSYFSLFLFSIYRIGLILSPMSVCSPLNKSQNSKMCVQNPKCV